MTSKNETITQAEAAKRLGISRQSLGMWAKRPGAPVENRRGVLHPVWPAFPVWREAEREQQVRREQLPPDLEAARTRKTLAEAELAEYDLAKARGEFIAVSDLDAMIGPVFDTFRAKLLAMPGRLAPRVVACRDVATAHQMLQEEVTIVLTELSA